MMARQHVTFATGVTGAGLGTAAYILPAVHGWVTERPIEVFLFFVMVIGGALVPDADHHASTIIKKAGWAGWLLHRILRLFGIRHRGFLHSALFAVICGVTFVGIEMLIAVNEIALVLVGLLFVFFSSITFGFVFGKVGRNPALAVAVGVGLVLGYSSGYVSTAGHWLAIAAFIGPLLHDVGDQLTLSKVPILYPFSKKNYGAPITFRTGAFFETKVLRYAFFAWGIATFAWVAMVSQGYLVKSNIAVDQLTDSTWWSESAPQLLPYVLWTFQA